MYLPWSGDLTSFFEVNIADLEKAISRGILHNEKALVYFNTSATEATLFELKYKDGKCVREPLKSYTNHPFTTASGITAMLNDVQYYAPASRYAMTVGCHGLGWIPVLSTRTHGAEQKGHWEYTDGPMTRWFGGTSVEHRTDISTLAEGIKGAGVKMDYILFDDCYMSGIEVAYELKDVTHHVIGSTSEIMAYGMPYSDIGEHLFGDVNYRGICEDFLSFYENYRDPYGTIGITVCAELDNLATLMKQINETHTFDAALTSSVQRLDGYSPVCFFDFGDYVDKLCTDPVLLSRFKTQLERVVPTAYRKHTDSFFARGKGTFKIKAYSGVTVSDPSTNLLALTKAETAWYKATH